MEQPGSYLTSSDNLKLIFKAGRGLYDLHANSKMHQMW
jgi:hypothetical protein